MNSEGMGTGASSTGAGAGAGATPSSGVAGKTRIYELAKELGLQNKDLVDKVRGLGIEAKNHMSNLEVEDVARVKRALDKERHENLIEERLTATVIRRRTKDGTAVRAATPATPVVAERSEQAEKALRVEKAERAERAERRGESAAAEMAGRAEAPAAKTSTSETKSSEEAAPSSRTSRERQPESPGVSGIIERRGGSVVVEVREKGRRIVEDTSEAARAAQAQSDAGRGAAAASGDRSARGEKQKGGADEGQAGDGAQSRQHAAGAPGEARAESSTHGETGAGAASERDTARESGRGVGHAEATSATGGTGPSGATADASGSAGARAPEVPSEPKKPEPVKFGPTGRVIDLPNLRQPVIQVTERGPGGGTLGARGVRDLSQKRDLSGRDRFAGKHQQGKKKAMPGKKQKSTMITTPAAHKRVVKMEETIAVAEIAKQMSLKATDVLKKLWSMGMTGINLNSSIDADAAGIVASEFGFEIENVAFDEKNVFAEAEDNPEELLARAPVVTIMGHVDHGKTSLLDAIRNANVAAGEAGGITQHIGAYKVTTPSGNEVVFLDTPGHEAFTAMRARGAQVTDAVVLVVAADDGVMPQTVEALQHAKDAGVPIIVAVNKIDKGGAQPERIRQQLSAHGLTPEAWGGETIFVDVSARTKLGIDTLLEMIALQSEVLELRANPNKLAKGTVIEAKLDRNRGPVATVLVQDGTLKVGDTVVAGEHMGKVRAMLDDKGRTLSTAGPSTPVEILGIGGVPNAGETFNSVSDEKAAKELVEHRRDSRRKKELAGTGKISLENILDKIKAGDVKELKIVLKADVQGSSEAVKDALNNLSNEQVKVDVISSGVGGITETDVNLAKAGGAIIVGFHVRPAGKAAQLAEQDQVDIKLYDIIYEALDDVKKAMAGLLAPVKREKALGKAEVRQTFTIPKIGTIAGCSVTEGSIKRSAQVRVVRDSVSLFTGKLTSLRRFKDDVREVQQGYECGIGVENYNDIKVGDVIEAFEIEEFAPTLV